MPGIFKFSTLGKAFMLSREQLPPWGVRVPEWALSIFPVLGDKHSFVVGQYSQRLISWFKRKKEEAGKRHLSREHTLAAPSMAFLALLSKWLQFELCRSELHFLCLQLPGLHDHIRMPLSDSVGFLSSADSKREMRSALFYNRIISI